MNRWADLLDNHNIWVTLDLLNDSLGDVSKVVEVGVIDESRRLEGFIEVLRNFLDLSNPEFISFPVLDRVDQNLSSNVLGNVRQYVNNKQKTHLVSANDYLTNIINDISSISLQNGVVELSKLDKIYDKSYDNVVKKIESNIISNEEKIASVKNEINSLINKERDLSNRLSHVQERSKHIFDEWQSQFSASQDSRLTEFNSMKKDHFSNAERQFSEKKRGIDNEFNELLRDIKNRTKNFEDENTGKIDELRTLMNFELEGILEDSKLKHKSILELFGLVAEDSVASGFMNSANNENSQANFWRIVAVLFIISASLWVFYFLIVLSGRNEFDVIHYLSSFSLVAILLYGATYSAQQSTKHRSNERQNRWYALQIKALDPFIHSLDAEQRKELKMEITRDLFGASDVAVDQDAAQNPKIADITKQVVDIIKAVQK